MPRGANAKSLNEVMKLYQKKSSKSSVMLFSVDDQAGKVLCLSQVGKEALGAGLQANDWIKSVIPVIGGKGGGKPANAQASGQNIHAVEDAITVATKFAQLKLSMD